MTAELLEQLLYLAESDSLDFKRDQYRFAGSSHEEKSELLKDVLAFTNSWCQGDAHILIGVQEEQGGKSLVTGFKEQLDDASLQQFINSKTNRPIHFSYRAHKTPAGDVAVITIPRQQRPFYLVRDFGKLRKNIVYVRRGSSTGEALPDEISRMGTSPIAVVEPKLDLNFSDSNTREVLGKFVTVKSRVLEYDSEVIPDYLPGSSLLSIEPVNRNYFRQYAEYERTKQMLKGFRFAVRNQGAVLLSNIRIKLDTELNRNWEVRDSHTAPTPPSTETIFRDVRFRNRLLKRRSVEVQSRPDSIVVTVEMLDVQPQAEEFSDDLIFIGGQRDGILDMKASVFGDNLAEPIKFDLKVSVNAVASKLDVDTLTKRLNRFG